MRKRVKKESENSCVNVSMCAYMCRAILPKTQTTKLDDDHTFHNAFWDVSSQPELCNLKSRIRRKGTLPGAFIKLSWGWKTPDDIIARSLTIRLCSRHQP